MRAVSDDRIAHIIVVRQLHTVEQYAVFQLGRVSDNAAAPCDDVSAQKSAGSYRAAVAEDYRRQQYRALMYRDIFSYDYSVREACEAR